MPNRRAPFCAEGKVSAIPPPRRSVVFEYLNPKYEIQALPNVDIKLYQFDQQTAELFLQDWTLFCPNEAFDTETGKGLMDLWGEDFEKLYEKLEADGKGRKTVKAQHLWFRILEAQMEAGHLKDKINVISLDRWRDKTYVPQNIAIQYSCFFQYYMEPTFQELAGFLFWAWQTGTPYMLYKDHANRKSNQQNLGTIHCSNLCTEIIEYTSPDEVAVCNLMWRCDRIWRWSLNEENKLVEV